jgi:predicted secreted protein
MATAGKQNATIVALYVGGVKITHATSSSIELSMETIDVTTKDGNGYSEYLPGVRGLTMSGDAFYADDATYGANALVALFTGRTAATIRYSTEVSGDDYFQMSGYMTSFSTSGGVEDAHTYSVSFQGTGALTFTTVT